MPAELHKYSEALRDYDAAILRQDKPFHNIEMDQNLDIRVSPYLWIIYFNRGNVKAELNDAAGAAMAFIRTECLNADFPGDSLKDSVTETHYCGKNLPSQTLAKIGTR